MGFFFIPEGPSVVQLHTFADHLASGQHKAAFLSLSPYHFPYGLWTTRRGDEILFSRHYRGLRHYLADDQIVTPCPPNYKRPPQTRQRILFDDDRRVPWAQYGAGRDRFRFHGAMARLHDQPQRRVG